MLTRQKTRINKTSFTPMTGTEASAVRRTNSSLAKRFALLRLDTACGLLGVVGFRNSGSPTIPRYAPAGRLGLDGVVGRERRPRIGSSVCHRRKDFNALVLGLRKYSPREKILLREIFSIQLLGGGWKRRKTGAAHALKLSALRS